MTLIELRYIVALGQTRHFGKAAALCHVSQPTLSVAINKLERSLGSALFERRPQGVQITPVGEKIIEQAKRVLEQAELLHQIAQKEQNQLQTPLNIGAILTLGPYLFPKLIPPLKQLAPHMPLILQETYTATLCLKLQQGELDAIFVALPFKEPGVVTKPLYNEEFVVVLPTEHPLAHLESIDPEQLNQQKVLLLGEGHCLRDQIVHLCPQCTQNNPLQQTVENASLETLCAMVASGYGITILPRSASHTNGYQHAICSRPFLGKQPQRTIALAWRDSFPRTKAIDALLATLKDLE